MDIAIIDDDATDRQKAASLLQDYIRKNHDKLLPSLRLTFFDSAEALLDGFIPGHFSLLLLDIYMQKITGMAAAKKFGNKMLTAHSSSLPPIGWLYGLC